MSSACLVGRITAKSAEKWREYQSRVPATLAPWGAELLFRGRQVAALAGHDPHTDIVAIRFPAVAAVDAWYASTAYQALLPVRQQAADVVRVTYQA
jgi:uncharacterized protein (DUF1330 family)